MAHVSSLSGGGGVGKEDALTQVFVASQPEKKKINKALRHFNKKVSNFGASISRTTGIVDVNDSDSGDSRNGDNHAVDDYFYDEDGLLKNDSELKVVHDSLVPTATGRKRENNNNPDRMRFEYEQQRQNDTNEQLLRAQRHEIQLRKQTQELQRQWASQNANQRRRKIRKSSTAPAATGPKREVSFEQQPDKPDSPHPSFDFIPQQYHHLYRLRQKQTPQEQQDHSDYYAFTDDRKSVTASPTNSKQNTYYSYYEDEMRAKRRKEQAAEKERQRKAVWKAYIDTEDDQINDLDGGVDEEDYDGSSSDNHQGAKGPPIGARFDPIKRIPTPPDHFGSPSPSVHEDYHYRPPSPPQELRKHQPSKPNYASKALQSTNNFLFDQSAPISKFSAKALFGKKKSKQALQANQQGVFENHHDEEPAHSSHDEPMEELTRIQTPPPTSESTVAPPSVTDGPGPIATPPPPGSSAQSHHSHQSHHSAKPRSRSASVAGSKRSVPATPVPVAPATPSEHRSHHSSKSNHSSKSKKSVQSTNTTQERDQGAELYHNWLSTKDYVSGVAANGYTYLSGMLSGAPSKTPSETGGDDHDNAALTNKDETKLNAAGNASATASANKSVAGSTNSATAPRKKTPDLSNESVANSKKSSSSHHSRRQSSSPIPQIASPKPKSISSNPNSAAGAGSTATRKSGGGVVGSTKSVASAGGGSGGVSGGSAIHEEIINSSSSTSSSHHSHSFHDNMVEYDRELIDKDDEYNSDPEYAAKEQRRRKFKETAKNIFKRASPIGSQQNSPPHSIYSGDPLMVPSHPPASALYDGAESIRSGSYRSGVGGGSGGGSMYSGMTGNSRHHTIAPTIPSIPAMDSHSVYSKRSHKSHHSSGSKRPSIFSSRSAGGRSHGHKSSRHSEIGTIKGSRPPSVRTVSKAGSVRSERIPTPPPGAPAGGGAMAQVSEKWNQLTGGVKPIVSNFAESFRNNGHMSWAFKPIDAVSGINPSLQNVVIIFELLLVMWVLYQVSLLIQTLATFVQTLCMPVILISRAFGVK